MKTGVLLLNFGEPETPSLDAVVPYLEAIFAANFRLEHAADPDAGRRRARELAERRAPALVKDYRRMGQSPLLRQTEAQARALEIELRRRHDCIVDIGMQFTTPFIEESVGALRAAGVKRIVGLPMYPLCGPSTTIFALKAMRRSIRSTDWRPDEVVEISGWHARNEYTRIRARAIRDLCARRGVDLEHPKTRLVFSAHGTPIHYLDRGSRYDAYVRNHCAAIAEELGGVEARLGYQNHANRPDVEWTQPEVAAVLGDLEADTVVVVPISFVQEQSETLVELDIELRETAESLGQEFHRVEIPHDDPQFISFLADLVDEAISSPGACRCRSGAFCFNQSAAE